MAIAKVILNGEVQMDVTSDTVEANKLLSGETATKNDGTKVTGTFVAPDPVISSLSVTPTESAQTFNETSISGYKPVTVEAIASDYIGSAIPMRSAADLTGLETYSGYRVQAQQGYYSQTASYNISEASINMSGPYFTYSLGYFSGAVNITKSGYARQNSYSFSQQLSTLSSQTITPGSESQYIPANRWLTGSQTIEAIASDYIGSAIPRMSSANMTQRGVYVYASAGYYSTSAIYELPVYTHLDPSITFYPYDGQISAKHDAYDVIMNDGLTHGNAYTTSSYQLPTLSAQTITPGSTTQIISSYQWLTGSQTIAAIPSSYIIPSGTSAITSNGTFDIANYASASVNVVPNLVSKSVTPTESEQVILPNTVVVDVKNKYDTAFAYTVPITISELANLESGKTYHITGSATVTAYASGANCDIEIDTDWTPGTQIPYTITRQYGVDVLNYITISGSTINFRFLKRADNGVTNVNLKITEKTADGLSQVTVGAIPSSYIIPSGTYSVTENGTYDIGSYASVDVSVSGGGGSTSMPYRIGYFTSKMTNGVQLASWSGHTARVYGTIGDQYYGPGDSAKTYYIDKYFDIGNTAWTETYSFGSRNLSLKFNSVGSNASPGLLTYIGYAALYITIMSDPIPYADMLIQKTLGNNTSLTTSMEAISGMRALAYYSDLEYFSGANVTTIYGEAFRSCTALHSVFFPQASFIGGSTFVDCHNLQSIEFPLVTSVGESAFCLCSFLRSVSMPLLKSTGAYTFANCHHLDNVYLPNIEILGPNTFTNCVALSRIDSASFPKLSTISATAFYSCSGLSYVDIPTVTMLSTTAFANCTNLVTASFLNCETIGVSAFSSCIRLQTVNAPKCQSIQQYAFSKCYSLISLYLTSVSSVTTLAAAAFTSTPIGGYSRSAGQYGSVYVPASLYNDFLIATNWSAISSRIVSV